MEVIPTSENKERILYPEISAEILKRAEEDQKMRFGIEEGGTWDRSIDQRNTEYMKKLIQEIGYPTISKVGKEASHMAWLLIQHADHDPEFQIECLNLLKSQAPGEVQLKEIGYLDDRVKVRKGELQLYGTQFYVDPDGVFGPSPIEDPEHLDERREAMQMGSFEGYKEGMFEANKKLIEGQNKNSKV